MWQGPLLAPFCTGKHDHYLIWRSYAASCQTSCDLQGLKLAEKFNLFFPPSIPNWYERFKCITGVNSHQNFPLHFPCIFLWSVISITHWLLKETPISTTWQAKNKAPHSFPLICSESVHRVPSCGRFCSFCPLNCWPLWLAWGEYSCIFPSLCMPKLCRNKLS